jgi:hypothetical protein
MCSGPTGEFVPEPQGSVGAEDDAIGAIVIEAQLAVAPLAIEIPPTGGPSLGRVLDREMVRRTVQLQADTGREIHFEVVVDGLRLRAVSPGVARLCLQLRGRGRFGVSQLERRHRLASERLGVGGFQRVRHAQQRHARQLRMPRGLDAYPPRGVRRERTRRQAVAFRAEEHRVASLRIEIDAGDLHPQRRAGVL